MTNERESKKLTDRIVRLQDKRQQKVAKEEGEGEGHGKGEVEGGENERRTRGYGRTSEEEGKGCEKSLKERGEDEIMTSTKLLHLICQDLQIPLLRQTWSFFFMSKCLKCFHCG